MIVNAIRWLACRSRKRKITTIVLHATAGSTFGGAFATLLKRGLSYHAIVQDGREQDGKVVKCVPDMKVAFHAGASVGPDGPGVNEYSLGLSFVNLNDGRDPYSEKQFQAAVARVVSWALAYPTVQWITTHYAISPGRKTDPRGFPVQRFMDAVNARLPRERALKLWG